MKHFQLQTRPFQILLAEFSNHIETIGYANGKKSMYPTCVREFLFWLEEQEIRELKKITQEKVIKHFDYLRVRPNLRLGGTLSGTSLGHHMTSLSIFFDFLQETERIDANPIGGTRFTISRGKKREILTQQEMTILFESTQTLRDRAILNLAYGCGLRRAEIAKLNISDLNFHTSQVFVRQGKGKKRRAVTTNRRVNDELKNYYINERFRYIKENTEDSQQAFLLNGHGKRMNGANLNDRLKELLLLTREQSILEKTITLHCLRHSIASHLLENGASIEFIRSFLGHASLDTAQIYLHFNKRRFGFNR